MTDTDLDTEGTEEEEVEETDTFVIRVNGEEVWNSGSEAMLVDDVSISGAGGELTRIRSSNADAFLDIQVHVRSYDAPDTYLDMIEAKKAQERRDEFEPDTSDRVNDDEYVAADPETGKPVEDNDTDETTPEPVSQEEQDREKAMAGDVEF